MMQDNDLPQIGTPMQTDETRAREVLAAQLEAEGFLVSARKLRAKGEMANGWLFASSIRAMLAFAAPPDVEREESMARTIVAYTGKVVSFDVVEPYYLASCDVCGWVGSTEQCPPSEEDAICPRCFQSGADCGAVAARLASTPTLHPSDREAIADTLNRIIALTRHEPDEHPVSLAARLLPIRQIARSAILAISGSLAPEGGQVMPECICPKCGLRHGGGGPIDGGF